MATTRVLLTGGAGYIGSHCALALAEAGLEPIVYDDLSAGHREAVLGGFIQGDIRDARRLGQVLRSEGIQAVMHFAALLNVGESVHQPLRYFETNVGGTLSLLSAMAAADVRHLVFSSTCAVYGDPEYLPLDETHPKHPVSPYGESKRMVETVLDAAREKEGFQVVSLRYFNAAGADPEGRCGESHHPEIHLIPLALEAAVGRRVLEVYGNDYPTPDGTCIRDYIHVADLADAHVKALQWIRGGARGAAFNLGTGKGTSNLEILESIERVTGRRPAWRFAPRRAGDPAALYAGNQRVREALGWEPRFTHIDQVVSTAWGWFQNPRY